jgi:hypothetical protein
MSFPWLKRNERIMRSAWSSSSVGKQSGRRDHLRRQFAQGRQLGGGRVSSRQIPGHTVQAFEHGPTVGKSVIQAHGHRKSADRRLCLPREDEAMPALLMQAAEARVLPLECGQRVQRIGDPPRKPLRDRRQQQRIALLRHAGQQGFSRGQGVGELVRAQQSAHRGEFGVDRLEAVAPS